MRATQLISTINFLRRTIVLHSDVLLLHRHGLELLLLAPTEQEKDNQKDNDGDHDGNDDTRNRSSLYLLTLFLAGFDLACDEVHKLCRDI
jgi:hypothetical protein